MKRTGTIFIIEELAKIGLSIVGTNEVYSLFKEWRKNGLINKKQHSDLRKKIKK